MARACPSPIAILNNQETFMVDFLRSLRRGPGDHRDVFAEFAVLLVFVVAEQWAAARERPRLRMVR
jgi:hypothetical protein